MSLERLLRPKQVAVLGGTWAENVIRECQKMGFQGELWPVHPTRKTMGGIDCFAQLSELPNAPDATFIGVNRTETIKTVSALSSMDAGGAVCFASGFSEVMKEDDQGQNLQQALLTAANGMPILGPNCYGFINYLDGALLWPDQHGGQRVDRGVAIITQSSNIAINMTMQSFGLPIAYVITTGNQAQQGLATLGESLLRDPRVTALGLHIEGFGDLPSYESLAATAEALGKPIVALKVGRSPQAQSATVSHTASLAGSYAGSQAFLQRLGFAQVNSVPTFLETLRLLHVQGALPNKRVISLSCSGGEAALMADAGLNHDIVFSELDPASTQKLAAILGPKVHLANPLDYHTYIWNDPDALLALFTAALEADYDIALLVMDFPRRDRCDATEWLRALQCFIQAKRNSGGQGGVVAILPEGLSEDLSAELIRNGITPFSSINNACAAIAAAASCKLEQRAKEPLLLPPADSVGRVLSEAEAKHALTKHEIPVPPNKVVQTADEAVQAAEIIGYPIVVKGLGLAHKSDSGAVFLNVHTPDETRAAIHKMQSQCEHFLIEEFIGDSTLELLVGIVSDPSTGFVLTLGAGGTTAELMQDQSHRLLPLSADEIEKALMQLSVWPMIKGYRGQPGTNIERLVGVIHKVTKFIEEHQTIIQELEINPLLVGEHHVVAADALIRVSDKA